MAIKSHRQLRHEREHNELADWMAERLEAFRPHATQITIVALIILVAVLGAIYYFGTENQASATDWSEYFAAFNQREPEKALEKLHKDKPNSPAGLWAAQTLGDMNVSRGAGLMFSDRERAKDHLDKADAFYKQVEAGAKDTALVARARLGLGKVYESLCKPEEALRYYQMVAASEKDSAIGKVAQRAAQRMEDPRQVELLAWFATQEPKRPAPLTGPGGGLPGLPNDLPDRPDISPPSGLDLDIGTGAPEAPGPSLPQPGTTTPEETKPEEAKPDKPQPDAPKSEEGKPAEKPATDGPQSE